jgi:hypothetical protein
MFLFGFMFLAGYLQSDSLPFLIPAYPGSAMHDCFLDGLAVWGC